MDEIRELIGELECEADIIRGIIEALSWYPADGIALRDSEDTLQNFLEKTLQGNLLILHTTDNFIRSTANRLYAAVDKLENEKDGD